jgi:uncharacterized protein (DUF2267 family)
MPMNEETLMHRLESLAPFANRNEARRAFDATLQAMRRGMNEDEADWLAVALGPALSAPLLRESHNGELSVDELYRWTKRYTKLRKGVAVEQAQVVCRTLAELLPKPDLERLERHLPMLAPLLRVPEGPEPPPRAARSPRNEGRSQTLAAGRPGSSRPLNEAGGSSPAATKTPPDPDPLHDHSLARAREPHNDTKLSSSPGVSQDRPRSFASAGQRGR